VAGPRELQLYALGESDYAELARGVHRVLSVYEAGQRGCVDDVCFVALLDHQRDEAADPVNYTHQVYTENPGPIFERGAPARACRSPDARVVAEDVHGAVVPHALLRERAHLLGLRHICDDCMYISPARSELVAGRCEPALLYIA
jgi:hypothetical protein